MDHREKAYRSIRRILLEGGIRSRRDLSRRRLAEDLQVTPSSVHWALMRLEAENILESRPQSGTFLRQLDSEEFDHLYDIRELIEPYAAARAAEFVTPEQLARLRQNCRQMAALCRDVEQTRRNLPAGYLERIVRVEHEFHGTIMEAARNPEAAHFVENLSILMYVAVRASQRPRQALLAGLRQSLREHRSIADALRRGDPVLARRRMRRHLRTGFPLPAPGGESPPASAD